MIASSCGERFSGDSSIAHGISARLQVMIPVSSEVSPLVLIADDDQLVREMLKESLQSAGFKIAEAKDGEEALLRIQQERPRVVLLDLLMPKHSGLDVLDRIHKL